MSGILKKLAAKDGSVFKDAENDISGEIPSVISNLIPNISENAGEIKKIAQSFLGMLCSELGDDKNIAVIRNIDGEIIISVLKSCETDLDIKSEKTIIDTYNINELMDQMEDMIGGDVEK